MAYKSIVSINQKAFAHYTNPKHPDGVKSRSILFFAIDELGQIKAMTLSDDAKNIVPADSLEGFHSYIFPGIA